MTNEKNTKQVSRLTGSLLARKGAAAPSPASLLMNQQVLNRFPASQDEPKAGTIEFNKQEAAPRQNAVSETDGSKITAKESAKTTSAGKGSVSPKKSNFTKSPKQSAAQKRIAMTLRMEEDSHLKLRLFSAHTRKSCQAILSEALDQYFADNGDNIPLPTMVSQHR